MSTRRERSPRREPAADERSSLDARGVRREARWRAGIASVAFAAAFLERWWFSHAWHEAGTLASAFYYGDANRLVDYAIAVAQGRPFDNGIPFHPPGWPLVLAGFLKLFGAGGGDFALPVPAVKALLAAISAAAVAVATLVGYEVAGAGAMGIVAFLGVFHFGHIVEGTVADTEALYSLCVTVCVLAVLRATTGRQETQRSQRSQRKWLVWGSATPAESVHSVASVLRHSLRRVGWAAVAGAAGGYAMLVRAEFVACAAILVACLFWAHREPLRERDAWLKPSRYVNVAVFAALYVLVLVPTTVWHWRSLAAFNESHVGRVVGPIPQFAPVTSYGPFNFAMANHEDSDGGPNRDHPLLDRCNEETSGRLDVGQLDLACPSVYDLYVHGYRIGLQWIAAHPGAASALAVHKLAMASGFLAHGYFVDDVGADVSGTRRRVDLVDPESRVLLVVHLALIGLGVWMLRRRPIALSVIMAPLAALVASTVLFYGYARLGTAYLPLVWVLEATALAAAFGSSPRDARRTAQVALVLIGLGLTVEWLRLDVPRRVALDGVRTEDGVLVQDETATIRRVSR